MHFFTFAQVREHHEKIDGRVKGMLRELEEKIVDGRDRETDPVPIYLTKWRLKTATSTFLKIRRKSGKYTSLDDITDYGGLRVLCMFNQDMPAAHKHLLDAFRELGYTLNEFIAYNWNDDTTASQLMNDIEASGFREVKTERVEQVNSGYKSLHYIVSLQRVAEPQVFRIEVQLRTLLQDVWGELEHSLAYKRGAIHPHIKKSFELLARDLETNDLLISHLRDISDKETSTEKFVLQNQAPVSLLDSSYRELKAKHLKSKAVRNKYEEYIAYVRENNRPESRDEVVAWADEGLELCEAIPFTKSNLHDSAIHCWQQVELGDWHFHAGRNEQAMKEYRSPIDNGHATFVVYFRIGQLYRVKGEIVETLKNLDRCEKLLADSRQDRSTAAAQIKTWLALTYWYMGEEYLEVALDKIQQAEDIALSENSGFDEYQRRVIQNNVCWYQLERFISLRNKLSSETNSDRTAALRELIDERCRELTARYEALVNFPAEGARTANEYDTAAWCALHLFYETGDSEYLEQARRYCHAGLDRKNVSPYTITSVNMHNNHIQEIMRTCREHFGDGQ